MKVFQIAIHGFLRMAGLEGNGFRVLLLQDGFLDNESLMRDAGAEILEAAGVRQGGGVLFFPRDAKGRERVALCRQVNRPMSRMVSKAPCCWASRQRRATAFLAMVDMRVP